MKKDLLFDVVVIGGGHAGCEAAAASARLGVNTALFTHNKNTIGEMSCNPAIGGLGKGHLVREIDALDGVMGEVADKSGIQFRLLNRSRGPAVRGPRTQSDRSLYRKFMQEKLVNYCNLSIFSDPVIKFIFKNNSISGFLTLKGNKVSCNKLILTTGTFLNGLIHIGDERTPAGRFKEKPSTGLSEQLEKYNFKIGRLKTGTPPRLDSRTINFEKLDPEITKFNHVLISLKENLSIDKLILKIKNNLENKFISEEDILITRERHRQHLLQCVDHLNNFSDKNDKKDFDKGAEDLRLATRQLGMIVGKVDVEEILGSIFNDFCIGK